MVALLAGLILFTACYNIAEFDDAFNGRLHIISGGDLSTLNTINGISGARSLLIYPGNLFVASTDGVVYRYDSESLALIGEYTVDLPSPAGFFQIASNQSAGSAYLIGAQGKIVRFSLPECAVLDVFSVCQSPVALAVAPGYPSYLYVGDGKTNTINQVSTSSYTVLTSESLDDEIHCIEAGWDPDTILVGTSGATALIEEMGPGNLSVLAQGVLFSNCQAIAAIPYTSNFIVVSQTSVGVAQFSSNSGSDEPGKGFVGGVEIEGLTPYLAVGSDWQHAYVLSYVGDFTSRLVSYDYNTFRIDQQIDLPGFPLDLKVSGNNVIYALTYE